MRVLARGGWTTALRVAGVAAVAAVALVIPASSFAVHDNGLFELDTTAPQYANTADDSGPGAPYDWASIFDSSGQQTLTSATEPRLLTADFSADSATPDTSYFASSNKDIDNVSSWQCGSVNNPTPKDEISNAYAALFRDANNHVILYAGGERDKNNGNSFMGFWIFKGAVGCDSPGNFSGQHTDGDVLILSNFTGGGTHPLVEVYEWTGGAGGGLSLMSSGGFCHSVGANDDVCGEANATPFNTTWAPHNALANPLDTNEFLEVGVDLTKVLSLATNTVPCFARFQAETRSSQETTATLKDYAAGRFNTCTTGTNSTPMSGGASVSGSSVLPGTAVTDEAVITGSSLVGTPPNPTGSVSFFLCGPQGTQVLAVCASGGTSVGSVNLSGTTNPVTVNSPSVAPTAPGWYCFRAVYSGDSNYPDGSFDSALTECFQVAKATPTAATVIHGGPGADDAAGAPAITSAPIGSTVHDQATVSGIAGTPTGTVSFTIYSGNTVCSGTGASAGTITLSGGIAHPSDDATVPVGGLSYQAHYNGSTLYDEADGPCEALTATQLTPNVSTVIHNASHQVVTAVETGSTVHDFVSVTGAAATPGGNVTIDWFTTNTCSGTADSTSGNVALDASGHADATGFPQGPLAAGLYGFEAHYAGDATYVPADGVCEPLRVVDANISITPSGVNRVGDTHTFTAHVNVNDGSGFSNASGALVTFSKDSGPGTLSGASCTTDASGDCTIDLTSSTTGVTTLSAHTTVSVSGVSLTRATDGTAGSSAPATKRWVDARISLSPNATNEVGTAHTFTVTLEEDTGDGSGFQPAAAEHVDFTLGDSNGANSVLDVAASTCDDAGANTNANGQCTIVFSSLTPGMVTADATAVLAVAGSAPFTVETDGSGANGSDAVKTFVDANIQISPDGVNRVGDTHTFTAHVNQNDGSGWANASGVLVSFTKDSGPGSLAAGSCTTNTSGDCTVDLTSSATGVTTVSAHATFAVGGVTLSRDTDGAGANSDPASKRWVDARISLSPNATNEVGTAHTFTVTLERDTGNGSGLVSAAGEHVDFTLTDANGANSVVDAVASTCDDAGANTDANGQCTITFTSATPGKVTVHAASTLSVAGSANFTVETDGVTPNGDDAVKTFVDANIQITPETATNALSANHTLTGHVNVNDGSGSFADAPDGTTIDFTIVSGPGSFVGPSSCTTSGGTGSCDVVITSATSGTTTIKASTDVIVGGVSLHRATGDANVGDSGDATKKWATARISIAPDATNEVGDPHTFVVTLEKNTGTGTFVPAQGEHVDFTLSDTNGASSGLDAAASTCGDAGANTDSNGQCTITFTSNTAGKVTGHASASLTIGGATVTTETDGTGGSSNDAVKTFVDANIQITPATATNPLGTNHVLTGHVNVNDGSGGFANAPEGTTISFSIVSGPGAFVGPSSCTTVDGSGSCTVTITSSATGSTKIRGATDVTVGGVSLHRETGDEQAGDGADATKLWASAKISIAPSATNEVGQSHTFTVTLLKDTSTGTLVPAAGEHVAVTLTDANQASHTAPTGTCTDAGANTDANGQCTITFTSQSAGTVTGHATSTLTIDETAITVSTDGKSGNSGDAVKTFVDANIQITPATAINAVGTTHTPTGHVNVNSGSGGFGNAPNGTTISFSLPSGPASFVGPSSCTTVGGTGSCTVVISSSTTGTTTIRAATDVTVGGVALHRQSGDAKANDSADALKLWADDGVRTDILNAAGGVVTTAVAGTIVHDKAFVTPTAGTPAGVPNPSGSVTFHRYATLDCSGTATNQTVALTPGSPSTAVSDDFAPTGNMSYRAEYAGDANYPARAGECEPLTVTPVPAPAIAIVKNPKGQTVAVGGTATFTITVTNVGNTVLTDVHVEDPKTPNCDRSKAQIPALASMAPGASVTYSCAVRNVRASFDNVAIATGTPPSGTNVTATDTAPVKTKALTPKKVVKKKKPKVVSHKKPKATG
jgi:hypothetical protein